MSELLNFDGAGDAAEEKRIEQAVEEMAAEDESGESPVEEAPETPEAKPEDESGGDGDSVEAEEKEGEEVKAETEEEAETTQEEKPKGPVPYSRFEEVVRQNQDMREKQATLDGRLTEIKELMAAQKAIQQAPQAPDPEEDPEGYQAYLTAQKDREINDLRTEKEAAENQVKINEEVQEVHNKWTEQANATDIPHYPEMQAFLIDKRREQLRAVADDPAQAETVLTQEIWATVKNAHDRNFNIPKVIQQYAINLGWRPPEPEEEKPDNSEALKDLEKTEKAKRTNKSISAIGETPEADLTEKDIDDMNDEEFQKFKREQFAGVNPLRA